jgi:MtN3 and saliva related transmembrane protein
MNNLFMNLIGLGAGMGTTFSFLPQVIHIIKTSNIDGLSPFMILVHFSGVGLWIIYGILKYDKIIISFNSITLFFIILITFKYIQIKKLKTQTDIPIV